MSGVYGGVRCVWPQSGPRWRYGSHSCGSLLVLGSPSGSRPGRRRACVAAGDEGQMLVRLRVVGLAGVVAVVARVELQPVVGLVERHPPADYPIIIGRGTAVARKLPSATLTGASLQLTMTRRHSETQAPPSTSLPLRMRTHATNPVHRPLGGGWVACRPLDTPPPTPPWWRAAPHATVCEFRKRL